MAPICKVTKNGIVCKYTDKKVDTCEAHKLNECPYMHHGEAGFFAACKHNVGLSQHEYNSWVQGKRIKAMGLVAESYEVPVKQTKPKPTKPSNPFAVLDDDE